MEVVYELAQEFHLPVLLHFEYGAFNTGFERFHRAASKHPCLNFNGITDRLLADYPNVYGDLSGNSDQPGDGAAHRPNHFRPQPFSPTRSETWPASLPRARHSRSTL